MPSQTLFIESDLDKTLLEIQISSVSTDSSAPGIIIAHPYGPLGTCCLFISKSQPENKITDFLRKKKKGGNMHNNVVIAIQRHFHNRGYVTVCLNFRGCGNSKGRTSWTGMPERSDYASVVRYLLESETYRASEYPTINQLILCASIPCFFN
jgi:predicted acyl esterase